MTDSHAITTTAPSQIQRSEMHPMVEMAMKAGDIDTEKMRELMQMQREWQAAQAKQAFVAAMVKLKSELPSVIGHDKTVDFTNKKGIRTRYTHTSAASAVSVIVPLLTKYGFSHSWTPSNTQNSVRVACKLTHADGHSEEAVLESPPDASGNKGPAQAIASTTTLLSRYTLLSILGIATADMKEPHGPKDEECKEHVDAAKNLQALAGLKQCGISADEACQHVGKDFRQWTECDLEKLRTLARSRTQSAQPRKQPQDDTRKQQAAELEALRVAAIDRAQELWGSDAVDKLDQLLRSNGSSFADAGLDALNEAMEALK